MRTVIACLALSFALTTESVIQAQESSLPPKHPFFDKPFALGAHRGGAGWRPENTLKTFEETAATWPKALLETDARMTVDGVVVLLHDDTVDRTTNGSGPIAEMTWEDASKLDAGYRFTSDGGKTFPYRGRGYRIPRLADALNALPNHNWLVELKDQPGIAEAVVRVINESAMRDRVLLASFNPELMRRAETLDDRIATCFDSHTRQGLVAALRGDDWDAYVPEDDVLTIWYNRMEQYGLSPADFPRIRAKGIPILVYTLDDAATIKTAFEQGVDSILTDHPALLAQVLYSRRQNDEILD